MEGDERNPCMVSTKVLIKLANFYADVLILATENCQRHLQRSLIPSDDPFPTFSLLTCGFDLRVVGTLLAATAVLIACPLRYPVT